MRTHRSHLHPATTRPALTTLTALALALALTLTLPLSAGSDFDVERSTLDVGRSGQSPVTLTLQAVFSQLLARHPALAAARAAAEASRARIDTEGSWMDPRLRIEFMRDNTNRLTTYDDLEFGITQEIPLSGRPRLRARAAAAEATVADAQATRREWLLLNQARTAFTRLAATDERLVTNKQLQTLLAQTRALLRLSYETSLRPQSDLLALDTDLARLAAERTDLLSARAQDAAQLNALLLNPAATRIAPATLPPPSPPALDLAAAVSRAREYSPDIAIALRETTAAGARLAIARKNKSIDPELMIAARHMNASSEAIYSYDTGIAFSLPWFNGRRNRAEIRAAESQLAAARSEVAATEAEVAGMAASAHARVTATHEQVRRYEAELIPLAAATTAAARRDYETGRASLPAVLDAERMTLDTRMKLADIRAEHALAAAELAFLTGADLSETNNK
ncbi:TolC family protein [Geminisphaera colitermitum]|uniref:TolC family protein n=1 Tax=Geminisphaera colitermitum TaxID=1148786 RepID=UPI0009DFE3B1|nr:TolC family protein [Geminisphaera colitermitum]